MTKSERLFEMLQYIKEYPHLTAQDLSRLCNISERGVYRYLNTLSRAGIQVRFHGDGYKVLEGKLDFLKEFNIQDLQSIRVLLSIGMANCNDHELLESGGEFIELIDKNLPRTMSGVPNTIEIIPSGVKDPDQGGAVTIGHSSRPDIINPILTSETISVNLMNLIFSSLVQIDETQRPIPDLAKDWEVSKDGLVWTFFLREDVTFHDGHPLTAHDVEFTYRTIMDPKSKSPKAERYEMVDRIETDGDYIFRISLKHSFGPFMNRLNREIAPKHLLEGEDLRSTPLNRYPVGSGPFKLVDWAEDDTIVLDANRDYFHRGRPILNRLIFKAYPDREKAVQAISHGEMDIALDLAAADLLFMSKSGPFRIYSTRGASYYALIFNLKDPLFKDIRVRKALDCAIDRESIVKNQLKGYSRICTGPFNINSWAYSPDVQSTPYSIESARDLLRQAGWRDTNGDGILDKDGKLFEFEVTVPDISDSLERIAVTMRAQLMKIGIRVKLVYLNDSNTYGIPFQAILGRISAGVDPDSIYDFWHSQAGETNRASYENRFVDELLEQGRRETDMEKRREIYHKIHKIIHDDCPAVFFASGYEFIGSNYRFKNSRFSSIMHFLSTVKDWQIIGGEREGMIQRRRQRVSTM